MRSDGFGESDGAPHEDDRELLQLERRRVLRRLESRWKGLTRDHDRRTRPAAPQRCGSFPVFRQGGSTWGSRVNYARQFPVKSPGRYRVTWKLGSGPLGPALQFRLPLS